MTAMITVGFAEKYGRIGVQGIGGEMEIISARGNIEVGMQAKNWRGRLCRWIKDTVSFPFPGRRNKISAVPLGQVKVEMLKDKTIDEKTQGLILKKTHRLEKQNIPFRVKHLRAMCNLIQPVTLSSLGGSAVHSK